MRYSSKDKTINDSFYGYFLRHNEDDGWDDKDKYDNFEFLTKIVDYSHVPIANTSVLDVGSGTGDLAAYLKERGVHDYIGIELYSMSAEYARMKYPEDHFLTGDFLAHSFDRTFEYVFSSGALAAVLDSDNYMMMKAFLKKMWSLATVGVACNFITRETQQEKDEELFLYDLDEVLQIVKEVAPDAQISYLQNRAGGNESLPADRQEFLQTHLYLVRG